jgi:hypothetical protein
MRIFSCFTREAHTEVPVLSFILAQSLDRARELARRELMDTPAGLEIEIVENGRILDILRAELAAA